MPDAMLPLAERLTSSAAVAIDRLAASPATLLHGDVRLDNLFFPADADAPPLIAVDWSNATRGPGPYDLAYFCCMAFTPERRREHEDRLLHLYHEALLERGVTGYRFDACFDDYRLSFLEPFMRMFFLLVRGHAEKGTDRPQRVLAKFVRHAAQAALDLDAGADRGLREPPAGRAAKMARTVAPSAATARAEGKERREAVSNARQRLHHHGDRPGALGADRPRARTEAARLRAFNSKNQRLSHLRRAHPPSLGFVGAGAPTPLPNGRCIGVRRTRSFRTAFRAAGRGAEPHRSEGRAGRLPNSLLRDARCGLRLMRVQAL